MYIELTIKCGLLDYKVCSPVLSSNDVLEGKGWFDLWMPIGPTVGLKLHHGTSARLEIADLQLIVQL